MGEKNITTKSSAAGDPCADRDAPAAPSHADEAVILVHGLWTPATVFLPHAHWLKQRGYTVRRFAYPSVRTTLSDNAQALERFLATTEAPAIHLVGHSLGGLIILEMLAKLADPRLCRVVLLGTPCVASHCARRLAALAGMPALLGRSIMESLSRARFATIAPQSPVEIGVLAGTRSIGLGRVVLDLPRPNDGVVTLDETRLPGAADFIALPLAHSEMLASRRCAAQIVAFLESGRFLHAPTP